MNSVCNIREAILCLPIGELLDKLKTDQLQPLEVLQAYQAKALAVNEEINAVCDFILEATEQAEALATLPREERGTLYGLPISVKVINCSQKSREIKLQEQFHSRSVFYLLATIPPLEWEA